MKPTATGPQRPPEPTMTAKPSRAVRILAPSIGVNFGYIAAINARNGRRIWDGEVYGTYEAALSAAADKAEREGWTVAGR